MNKNILELWPEIALIQDKELRGKTANAWEYAIEKSVISMEDLEKINLIRCEFVFKIGGICVICG